MDLILWRHCDAENGTPDELRRLTPRGIREAQRMAAWLAPRLPANCRILVSPALRAQQTAQALGRPFETEPGLASGGSVAELLSAAGWPDAPATAALVGHEPTLGRAVAQLTSRPETECALAKGAVVWLATDATDTAVLKAAIAPGSLPP